MKKIIRLAQLGVYKYRFLCFNVDGVIFMSIGDRLRKLRSDKGVTVEELCKELDLRVGTYRHYEYGEREPNSFAIIKLSRYYKVSPDYILMGVTPLQESVSSTVFNSTEYALVQKYRALDERGKHNVEGAANHEYARLHGKAPFLRVVKPDEEISEEIVPSHTPTYTQTTAVGLGNYIDDDHYELVNYPDIPSRANIAVKISGDSMEPKFFDGDVVFVETESVLEDGEIGIFIYDGDSFIKKLRTHPARLVSLNNRYNDIILREGFEFRTVGRVVGVAGR
ncbi:MAG: XRE family transcriptional regulator [Oscillospiraceae bacterium]|nr:XRE family transcriptional regulator [Oscillospiraceae bacterium]